jgi:hypothetical protein
MLKQPIAKVKNNIIGTAAGALVTYWAVGKYTGVSKMWVRVGLAVLGGVAGAYAQSAISAKKSTPSVGTVKK